MDEAEVFGDRTHRLAAPTWVVFKALTAELDEWLDLAPGDVRPQILAADEPHRVVWSSLWPVSPDDTVEFQLSRSGGGTELRFIWRSPSPPYERGIAITRQRLNRKLGGNLRGWTDSWGSPVSWDPPPGRS